MPYQKPSDAPEWVQKKGDKAAEIWIAAFNEAFKEYGGDEERAMAVAAAAVKKHEGEEAKSEVMTRKRRSFVEAFPDTFEGTRVTVQLFPIGSWDGHDDGPLEITKDHLESAVHNFETTGRVVAVDFDHGLDYGTTPETRRAAGWIRKLELRDDGLWAEFDATEEAADWIRGGQYRFISPTFTYSYANKETGEDQGFTLLRAGLTNMPWFDGMEPCIAASERAKRVMGEYEKSGVAMFKIVDATDMDGVAEMMKVMGKMGHEFIGLNRDYKMGEHGKANRPDDPGSDASVIQAALIRAEQEKWDREHRVILEMRPQIFAVG